MNPIKNLLIGIDQSLNCIIKLKDGWGSPDETLSARAWRLRKDYPSFHIWIDFLFFWDKDHCKESYEVELYRKQLPKDYV